MNTVGCVDRKLQARSNFAHKDTDRQTQKNYLTASFNSGP